MKLRMTIKAAACLAIAIATCRIAAGGELNEAKIREYLAQCDAQRGAEIDELESEIARMQRGHGLEESTARYRAVTQAIGQKRLAIAKLKKGETRPEALMQIPPAVGAMGHLGNSTLARVTQVIDAQNMLADLPYNGPILMAAGGANHIDSRTLTRFSGLPQAAHVSVWFRGVSTAGIADGTRQAFAGVYEAVEVKQYSTALGVASSVVVLEPIDMDAVKSYLRQHKPQKPGKAKR